MMGRSALRKTFIFGVTGTAAVLLSLWMILPAAVSFFAERAMEGAGLTEPRVEDVSVGLSRSSAGAVSAGWDGGTFAVTGARFTYRLKRLFRELHADTVFAERAEIRIRPGSGGRPEESEEDAGQADRTGSAGVPVPSLPFDAMGIGDLTLVREGLPPIGFRPFAGKAENRIGLVAEIRDPEGLLWLEGDVEEGRLRSISGFLDTSEAGKVFGWMGGLAGRERMPEAEDFSVGLRWDDPATPNARARIEAKVSRISLGGWTLPSAEARLDGRTGKNGWDLNGMLRLDDGRETLEFSITSRMAKDGSGTGWIGFGPKVFSRWSPAGNPDSAMGDSVFTGTVTALVSGSKGASGFESTGFVRIRDGEAGPASVPDLVRGIEVRTALDLAPVVFTSAPQTLRFDRIVVDRFESGNGRIQWSLARDGKLTVSEAEWSVLGGRLSLREPVGMEFGENGFSLPSATLDAEGIDLEEIVRLVQLEKVDAKGRLNGRLTVSIKEGRVDRFQSSLRLETEEGASLRFGDLAFVREMLGKQASGASGGSDVLVRAVSDLRLRSFDLELDALADGKNTFVEIRGGSRAPDIEAPDIRLDFNLAIPYEKVVRLALAGRGLSFGVSE